MIQNRNSFIILKEIWKYTNASGGILSELSYMTKVLIIWGFNKIVNITIARFYYMVTSKINNIYIYSQNISRIINVFGRVKLCIITNRSFI